MFPVSLRPLPLDAMASAATPAIRALQAAGISYEVRQFRHDPRATSFGDEAVAELAGAGFVAAQIFKTLVLAIPGGLAVAVLPVPDKLSFKAAAAALVCRRPRWPSRPPHNVPPGMSSAEFLRWDNASRCRRSSTSPHCVGTGCCAARASAGWTSC